VGVALNLNGDRLTGDRACGPRLGRDRACGPRLGRDRACGPRLGRLEVRCGHWLEWRQVIGLVGRG
jgi:hypothetical protein